MEEGMELMAQLRVGTIRNSVLFFMDRKGYSLRCQKPIDEPMSKSATSAI